MACSAGSSRSATARAAATCIAVGKLSLDDWPLLTWSLGWTGLLPPRLPVRISLARPAITSLAFMLDWVPEPVCQMTRGNWSSCSPRATSPAACWIASASSASSPPISRVHPRRRLLHEAERVDDLDRHLLARAEREILDRALRLRAPIGVGRNLDRPEAVGLGTGRAGAHHGPLRSAESLVGGEAIGDQRAAGEALAGSVAGHRRRDPVHKGRHPCVGDARLGDGAAGAEAEHADQPVRTFRSLGDQRPAGIADAGLGRRRGSADCEVESTGAVAPRPSHWAKWTSASRDRGEPVRHLGCGRAAAGERVGGQCPFIEAAEAQQRWPMADPRPNGSPRRSASRLPDRVGPGRCRSPGCAGHSPDGSTTCAICTCASSSTVFSWSRPTSAQNSPARTGSPAARMLPATRAPPATRTPPGLWKQWAAVRIHRGVIRAPVQK